MIGLVENMAGYACPHCGEVSDPFGKGGAEAAAAELGVPFLGRMPLAMAIRAASDAGTPPAAGNGPEARGVQRYGRAGRSLAEGAAAECRSPPTRISATCSTNARTIAMVGASDRPDRPSYGVMAMLQRHGYRVIPVNPQITGEHVHGEFVFRELAQIGEPIDMVDIFRRPQAAGEAVDEAIAAGAKAVWMQMGVINEEAAARAEAAGLKVVMDRCPAIDIPRLGVPRIAA